MNFASAEKLSQPILLRALHGDRLRSILLVLFTVAFLAENTRAQACIEPSFRTARNVDAGLIEPFMIATADFNNDGHVDLVTGGNGPPSFRATGIAVLLGHGNGSFERRLVASPREVGGAFPVAISVGDFDGDGNTDLVEGGSQFYFGDGTGNFRGPVEHAISGQIRRVYASDLNNDGKSDLLVLNLDVPPFFTVRLANSSGGFDDIAAPSLWASTDLDIIDLNGDNKKDLLLTNQSLFQVALGDGTGHFVGLPEHSFSISKSRRPLVADFNSDGKLDLVVTGGIANSTVFFPGDGTGQFGSPISTQSSIDVAITADFNKDGKLDVAGRDDLIGLFRVGFGDGAGHFTLSRLFGLGGSTVMLMGMTAADFNEDGNLDVGSVSPRSNDLSIVFGDGAGSFESGDFYPIQSQSQIFAVATGDFTGDGNVDFAVSYDLNRVRFFDGNGAGVFTPGRFYQDDINFNYATSADFNHDNRADLLLASESGHEVVVLFGGLGDVTNKFISLLAANGLATADVNGDGHLDIVALGNDRYGIVLGNGAGAFSPIQTTMLSTRTSGIAVGDFNGDAKPDFAVSNREPNNISILLGDGAGGFSPGLTVDLTGTFFQQRTIAVADFNGDSKSDLALASRDSEIVQVALGNGSGGFGAFSTYPVGGPPIQILARDMNADGVIDLATVNARDNSNVSVLMNDGVGSFLPRLNYGTTWDPKSFALGDFNNDGQPDLSVAGGSNEVVQVILSGSCRTPDLALKKTHQGNFAVGVPASYRLDISNIGLSRTAAQTIVTDVLPIGISFVSGTGTGWLCSAVGQTVTCAHAGRLEAGEVSTITLAVSPTASAIPGVTNTASVSTPFDSKTANDSSSDHTIVNNGISISGRITDESANALGGVTVVLNGPVKQSTVTDANGDYSFAGLPEGQTYTVTPSNFARLFVPGNRVFKNLYRGGSGSFTSRSQTNGKIVFSAGVGNGIEKIMARNADGTGFVQLTQGSESDHKPTWSPDGSKILFHRGADQNARIFVMNADGSDLRMVSNVVGESPVWSPDGKKVLFWDLGLHTINLDGTDHRRIFFSPVFVHRPTSWSPDGSRIAFTLSNAGSFDLLTIDPSGTSKTVVVGNNTTTEFEPDYSPDGLRIVYVVHDGHITYNLAVANADGSNQILLDRVTSDTNPSWSPDGSRIVFNSINDISTINPDGSGRTNLIGGKDPDWQPIITTTGPNQIDDAEFFVRRHYQDFLNREPDAAGLAFWKNEITSCGTDQQCIDSKRTNVSAAFYLSIEFQQTGYFVERIYKSAFGDAIGTSSLGGTHQLAVPIIRQNEFLTDTQIIGQGLVVGQPGWENLLESNKQAFSSAFAQRPQFVSTFPVSMPALQFVNSLNANAGNPLSTAERDQLVADLTAGTKTRAQVLRAVAEDEDLDAAEFNRAFVLMQYFGYLRRNPNDPQDTDYTGYEFWLTKLNQFNGNFVDAEMVKAFITSTEYRQRFGP